MSEEAKFQPGDRVRRAADCGEYTASLYENFYPAVNAPTYEEAEAKLNALVAEVRAAALREAADYADRKADKFSDYCPVSEQAADMIADGLRFIAEEETE